MYRYYRIIPNDKNPAKFFECSGQHIFVLKFAAELYVKRRISIVNLSQVAKRATIREIPSLQYQVSFESARKISLYYKRNSWN
ncbi:hypothetical protein RclHR1_08920003 [Rhizophagus clarus]|uniref:Uncharacterized protein n=1 Tax=Rhizophagus clarus TaxID=94130 RepID=A0A2Z6S2P8_9GLOM|nr:hypothetical protein RclHR1_08920003 [Rhizophagus clarus]